MNILNSLAVTESGGNFTAQNSETGHGGQAGHYGRLQFGHARLQDAMRAGVIPEGTTPQQFMANPALQERTEAWHKQDMMRQAGNLGLTQYIGQEINGTPITMDAILAMGHLGGMGGASKYLKSGGRHNPADSFGTSLADYARTHGGASQYLQREPARNAMAQPQTDTQNAMLAQHQQMAVMRQMMPQTNALSTDAFRNNSYAGPQYGFGAGANPFTQG